MKLIVKKSNLVICLLLGLSLVVHAQAKKKANEDTENWKYELEPVQTGVQGTYLVKVWSYSKKPTVAINQAKKNAVHGIIFQGFVGKEGIPGQKPLTNNPNLENEKSSFFDPFFGDEGKYMKYITSTGDGAIASEDIIKIGKQYKVGVIVSVNVAALRKDLEDAGIIRGLSSGF